MGEHNLSTNLIRSLDPVTGSASAPGSFQGNNEKWRSVDEYEGLYSVSSLGRVRSEGRAVASRGGARYLTERILKQSQTVHGYLFVCLYRKGKCKSTRVHRIVARAFLGKCPNGMVVLHGPAGKKCNMVKNLSYGTLSQNQADRVRDGTDNAGEACYIAKLTPEIVMAIRASKEGCTALARRYGVTKGTVYHARHRLTWKHLP